MQAIFIKMSIFVKGNNCQLC